MNKDSRIYVAGSSGLVGKAIVNNLTNHEYEEVITTTHSELDLSKPPTFGEFLSVMDLEYVFLAAARVGGIYANNTFPAEFIYQNLSIQTNVIHECYLKKVKKLMFLGSVCIYPLHATVPVKEESLLTGELEDSNQWYAVAKIAGIKMCQAYRRQYGCDFISVMPCNLYGIGDNFHPDNSHVITGLIRKFVNAKENNLPSVTCWGTGEARREFMYMDDMADACVFLMNNYSDEQIINIGTGVDYTIKELAEIISELTGYEGEIIWDTSKPNGTPKRMLDSTRLLNLGWKPKVSLRDGLAKTIEWYIKNK